MIRLTEHQRRRQERVDRENEATRSRPAAFTEEQAEEIRRKVAEPREFEVVRVDKPYLDDFIFKGRWVVHIVESDGVVNRPSDKLFGSEDEALAYYQDITAV